MPSPNPDSLHAFMPYPKVGVANAASGPLQGLTFAVKDLFDVAGYPTSAGQPHFLAMSGIKTQTAPVVQRLLDAGAAFVGKTVTDELAFSLNGQNAHFGSPVNGADARRISGGSSSGSASAVAGGLCDFALGTDTGGSIRAPASHNGLYGLRPTHGRIDMTGSHALAPSFDTLGWFARDADVYARVASVLLPTMPDCAPLIEESEAALENYRAASLKMLCVSGLTGLPQISLPIGRHQGVPLGLSLLGPANSDDLLVAMAQQVAKVAIVSQAAH